MAGRKELLLTATLGLAVSIGCSPEKVLGRNGDSCSDAIPLAVGSNRWTIRESGKSGRFEEQKVSWGLKYRDNNFPQEFLGRHVLYLNNCYYLLGSMPLRQTTYSQALLEGVLYIKKP